MSGSTLPNLPTAVQPLSGTELLYLVQGGADRQTPVSTLPGAATAQEALALAQAALPNTIAALASLMTAWLNSLPTSPQSSPGWWNNSGQPVFS
jgi:hypothetical protein